MGNLNPYRIRGALLGLAVGDALGAPVDGMSHQNIRTHVRGVKGFDTEGPRGRASPGVHTARAVALARALAGAPAGGAGPLRDVGGSGAAACAAPAGIVAAARDLDDGALATLLARALGTDAEALSAAVGQARAVALALVAHDDTLAGPAFLERVARAAESVSSAAAVHARLRSLVGHLDETPLDLQDRCAGTGPAADEAFPFAAAMFAREPALVEATLLSAINVGGASSAVGAMTGALLGALNGWDVFPDAWHAGLEHAGRLIAVADALERSLAR